MRILVATIFYFLLATLASGQSKTISIGPQLDIPANFGKTAKLGLGASTEGVFNFNASSAFRVYAGYSSFKGKFLGDKVSFVPVRAGYQYFISPEDLYVYGEGGPVFYVGGDHSPPQITLAFGAGSQFIISDKSIFNFSVFYNYIKGPSVNYTWGTRSKQVDAR